MRGFIISPPTYSRALLESQSEEVISIASGAITTYSSGRQAELLHALLQRAFCHSDGEMYGFGRVAVQLPLKVYSGIRASVSKDCLKLAAALLLLEVGIYTLDHLMDSEFDAASESITLRSALLGACCLISYVPQRLILEIRPDDSGLTVTLLRQMANGLGIISDGQLADFYVSASDSCSSASVERVISLKTGERRRLYAAMAATLAGGTLEQVSAYSDYAGALGMARQLRSDLYDLFGSQGSRDLANGTLTFPLALHLERSDDEERTRMRELLAAASGESEMRSEICNLLRSSGAMREVAIKIETLCQRALTSLGAASPLQEAYASLRDELTEVSLIS